MFQELMPLLAQRTLLLMISRVGADEIRINVIPQRLKSTNTDQNDALLAPLSISGTPKELDEALPAQLVEFVGTYLGLGHARTTFPVWSHLVSGRISQSCHLPHVRTQSQRRRNHPERFGKAMKLRATSVLYSQPTGRREMILGMA